MRQLPAPPPAAAAGQPGRRQRLASMPAARFTCVCVRTRRRCVPPRAPSLQAKKNEHHARGFGLRKLDGVAGALLLSIYACQQQLEHRARMRHKLGQVGNGSVGGWVTGAGRHRTPPAPAPEPALPPVSSKNPSLFVSNTRYLAYWERGKGHARGRRKLMEPCMHVLPRRLATGSGQTGKQRGQTGTRGSTHSRSTSSLDMGLPRTACRA